MPDVPTPDDQEFISHHQETLRQILDYWLVHPEAKDTLRGIRKWWRPAGRLVPTEADVQQGLDFLAARGWLTERQVTPTQKVYGVNKQRLAEIKAFLQESE
jgi:hypothetical protein